MLFLETQRLRLRNVEPKDADVIYDYRNNEICARYQRGQTRDYAGITALIERRKNDAFSAARPFMAAVTLRETDEMVGEIVAFPQEETITLGYTFSYRHHRRGYAFEALTALIGKLHEMAPDWEFLCFTEPENEASMALLRKLGYEELGYAPSKQSMVFGKWTKESTKAEISALDK